MRYGAESRRETGAYQVGHHHTLRAALVESLAHLVEHGVGRVVTVRHIGIEVRYILLDRRRQIKSVRHCFRSQASYRLAVRPLFSAGVAVASAAQVVENPERRAPCVVHSVRVNFNRCVQGTAGFLKVYSLALAISAVLLDQ